MTARFANQGMACNTRQAARIPYVRADLHIHTVASDGQWTPDQVIAGCLAKGIGLLAVTDHDSVESVETAELRACQADLAFLRGVEISTMVGETMLHVLGYGIDPTDRALLNLLAENRAKMEATDDDDIRRLIGLGYDMDYDAYLSYDYDRRRGGFKSLNACIDQGICADVRDFFDRIRPQLGDVWPDFVHPREAVAIICNSGGIPVLAHPGASLPNVEGDTLLPLVDYGIQGLECYSESHDLSTTVACLDWCQCHGLLVTGGSDFHGGYVGRELGVPVVNTSQLRLGSLVTL